MPINASNNPNACGTCGPGGENPTNPGAEFDQNNVGKFIYLSNLILDPAPPFHFQSKVVEALNNRSFTVLETDTPVVIIAVHVWQNYARGQYRYLFMPGAGNYGIDATEVNIADLLLITKENYTIAGITNDPNAVVIDLGVLPDDNFIPLANEAERDFTDVSKQYFFIFTLEGVDRTYRFTGPAGNYGGSWIDQFSAEMFTAGPTSNDQPVAIPPLEEVTAAGNTSSRPISIIANSETGVELFKTIFGSNGWTYQINDKQIIFTFPESLTQEVLQYDFRNTGNNEVIAFLSDLLNIDLQAVLAAGSTGNANSIFLAVEQQFLIYNLATGAYLDMQSTDGTTMSGGNGGLTIVGDVYVQTPEPGDTSQKVANTEFVDLAIEAAEADRDSREVAYVGTVYDKSSWNNLDDFSTPAVANIELVGNKLRLPGGTGSGFNNYVEHKFYTNRDKWVYTASFIPEAKTTTSHGFGFTVGDNPIRLRFDATSNASSGQLSLSASLGNGTATSTALAWEVGHEIQLYLARKSESTFAWAINRTTGATTNIITKLYNTYWLNSIGRYGLVNLGGSYLINRLTLSSSEFKNATVMFLGDSKAQGNWPNVLYRYFTRRLADYFGNTTIHSGPGDVSADFVNVLPEVIADRPQNVILSFGCNDIRAGIPLATLQANYQIVVNTLQAAGIRVLHLNPIWESGIDQEAFNTWIKSTYDANDIYDVYSITKNMPSYLESDLIHPNLQCSNAIYDFIVQTNKIKPGKGLPYSTELSLELLNANIALKANTIVPITITANVTTPTTPNSRYITNAGTQLTIPLPLNASSSIGDFFEVRGRTASGWKITQPESSTIIRSTSGSSTAGATGFLASAVIWGSVRLEKTAANEWTVVQSTGTITFA